MVPNGTFPGEIQFVGERGESTNNARQRRVCKLKAAAWLGGVDFSSRRSFFILSLAPKSSAEGPA